MEELFENAVNRISEMPAMKNLSDKAYLEKKLQKLQRKKATNRRVYVFIIWLVTNAFLASMTMDLSQIHETNYVSVLFNNYSFIGTWTIVLNLAIFFFQFLGRILQGVRNEICKAISEIIIFFIKIAAIVFCLILIYKGIRSLLKWVNS